MAKYMVEYVRSKEILTLIEAPSIKHLFDIVRSDFRLAIKHIDDYGEYNYIPYETASFYKWDEVFGYWEYLGSMYVNILQTEHYHHRSINAVFGMKILTLYERSYWSKYQEVDMKRDKKSDSLTIRMSPKMKWKLLLYSMAEERTMADLACEAINIYLEARADVIQETAEELKRDHNE